MSFWKKLLGGSESKPHFDERAEGKNGLPAQLKKNTNPDDFAHLLHTESPDDIDDYVKSGDKNVTTARVVMFMDQLSQEQLLAIAKQSTIHTLRVEALDRTQASLEVALEGRHENRIAALDRLDSPDLLTVTIETPEERVARSAAKRIQDAAVLSAVTEQCPFPEVREFAKKRKADLEARQECRIQEEKEAELHTREQTITENKPAQDYRFLEACKSYRLSDGSWTTFRWDSMENGLAGLREKRAEFFGDFSFYEFNATCDSSWGFEGPGVDRDQRFASMD